MFNKKMIKKIWNDPVGSKVIAAGVLFAIAGVCSLLTTKPVVESLKDIWEYSTTFEFTFRLVYVVGVIFLLWILYPIVSKLVNKNKKPVIDEDEERRKQFCEANKKREDVGNKLLYRFTTNISPSTNLPYVTNLKVYCTKHKIPLEVYLNGCTSTDCKNGNKMLDLDFIERTINSILVYSWEELNNK
jgi:hypothetical protein